MARTRRRFTAEFKTEAVGLLQEERPAAASDRRGARGALGFLAPARAYEWMARAA